jgi:phytoene desaturase
VPYFDYGGTIEQMEAQIRKFGGDEDVEGFRKYLTHSKKIFDVGFTELGSVPFHKLGTMLKCAPDLIRLENYKTVWGMAKKYIRNENLRRVFSFQPLLVGGNPFNTTSIYSLIFYLEREWGVQFAMGGTGAIVRGLEKLMREEGVEIRLGEEVEAIEVNKFPDVFGGWEVDNQDVSLQNVERKEVGSRIPIISGLVLKGGEFVSALEKGDLVVCNADAPFVYDKLLDPRFRRGVAARRMNRRSEAGNLKYSMGLFVLYFGTKKPYPEIAHHTIVLGESYRELIDTLFDAREIETKDLSVYLHRPTATDPSMAPAGCESFYVLVPVPNLQPKRTSPGMAIPGRSEIPLTSENVIDWSRYGDTFLQHVLDYLERTVLPGLRENIVDPFYVTPEHFKNKLNSMHGAGFSIQPLFSQSAYFRFHNKAPGIEGLYFVGAGTHPGAGMPGVLCSAKVLEHLIPDVKTGMTKPQ